MATSRRQTAYWFSVALYTLALAGALLYLRFPEDSFRLYVEKYIEDRLPAIRCSIGDIAVAWPPALHFRDVRLRSSTADNTTIFADPRLSLAPVWSSPGEAVAVSSGAYGGDHRLIVSQGDGDTFHLRSMNITALDLAVIEPLVRKLDRRITGLLDFQGTAVVAREDFTLLRLEAEVAVRDGEMALKRPILELDTLQLEKASASISLVDKVVAIADGQLENQSLSATFSGRITIAEPLQAGSVSLAGSMTPRPALFQQNRQLKVIVNRMQQGYGSEALPFEVGGTVGRPTFVFAR